MDYETWLIIVGACGYLLGSVPWSFIVAEFFGKDLHKVGSGNVGAMNVWRATKNPWPAVLALSGDMAKGAAAIGMALFVSSIPLKYSPDLRLWRLLIASACVVIGHNWPIWLKFKGGRGLACLMGALLVLNPIAAPIVLGTIIVSIFATELLLKKKVVFKQAFLVFGSQVLGRVIGIALAVFPVIFLFDRQLFWIFLPATVIALIKHIGRTRRYLSTLKVPA